MTADAEQLTQRIAYLNTSDRLQVMKAFEFARREHGTQRRKTGELFFHHPLAVATYLADYRLDADALSAALLHDIAEDTKVSLEEISDEFGPEVAKLVDGVTKLKEVTRAVAQGRRLTSEELQQATLQKLFAAMTTDVRTVIIKLFDRLHNMRTIHALHPHKQKQKARETLDVFAPLAYRLGMWEVKSELEGLCLKVLEPRAHDTIRSELVRLRRQQEPVFAEVQAEIRSRLEEAGLPVIEIRMAPENIYTVYEDIVKHGVGYRDLDRVLRVTVLLENKIDCYAALGHLHAIWHAVPHRFDDYISVQRENLYQSLHTTVVYSNGQPLKIRLRTVAMDRVAQMGILARWLYARTPLWTPALAERLDTFFASITDSITVEPLDPRLSVQSALRDVLGNQIRVYTPKGDSLDLVEGGTPIDFAYRIHTELGNRCNAVYVNDLLSPLNRPLRNGDQIRVYKSDRAEPQRAWLDEDLGYIATTYARTHARRWFRRLPEREAIRQGRQLLQHELEMLGLPGLEHKEIAALFGYQDANELYHRLGRAELLPTVLSTRIMSDHWEEGERLPLDNVVAAADGSTFIITNADNRKLRLCTTCDPHPRDAIVGYLRKDGAVTVHREGCHTLNAIARREDFIHRRLKLGWGEVEQREARLVMLNVDVYDRPGLLYDITRLMREQEINIPDICTHRHKRQGEVGIDMYLEVTSPRQMVRILHQIEALVNVKGVRCVSPDNADTNPATGLYRPE